MILMIGSEISLSDIHIRFRNCSMILGPKTSPVNWLLTEQSYFKFLEDISPFCGVTDTFVFDFW